MINQIIAAANSSINPLPAMPRGPADPDPAEDSAPLAPPLVAELLLPLPAVAADDDAPLEAEEAPAMAAAVAAAMAATASSSSCCCCWSPDLSLLEAILGEEWFVGRGGREEEGGGEGGAGGEGRDPQEPVLKGRDAVVGRL